MGACCTRPNNLEDVVNKHFKNMKLRNIDYETAKGIFDMKLYNLDLNEEFRMKLSGKSLTAFENSLKKISKDNLLKLADTYFIDASDNAEHIKTQKLFLQKVTDSSNNNKITILFNLLCLLRNGKEKQEKLLELCQIIEGTESVKFPKFKNIMKMHLKHNLILPMLALKECMKDSLNNKEIIEDLEEQLTNTFNDRNIDSFLHMIFEDFEKFKFVNYDDNYMEKYTVEIEDIYEIFRKYNLSFFNFNGLRGLFLSHYQ